MIVTDLCIVVVLVVAVDADRSAESSCSDEVTNVVVEEMCGCLPEVLARAEPLDFRTADGSL